VRIRYYVWLSAAGAALPETVGPFDSHADAENVVLSMLADDGTPWRNAAIRKHYERAE
jgi:hypothetical protein